MRTDHHEAHIIIDTELDAALLRRIQELASNRVLSLTMYALSFNTGVGPRVAEPSLGKIPRHYHTSPFEDMRLKGN